MKVYLLAVRGEPEDQEVHVTLRRVWDDDDIIIEGMIPTEVFLKHSLPWEVTAPIELVDEAKQEVMLAWETKLAIKKAISLMEYADNTKKRLYFKLRENTGFTMQASVAAVRYLEAHSYFNEKKSALLLAETMAKKKHYGKKRIQTDLYKKDFEKEAIQYAISTLEDEFSINFTEICAERIRKLGGLSCFANEKERNKMLVSLMRHGFSYAEVKEAVKYLQEE